MSDDFRQWERDELALEILDYLADHPNAGDTLEGIVQWWLLERRIKNQESLVKEALGDLIDKGLVAERKDTGARQRYRLVSKRS